MSTNKNIQLLRSSTLQKRPVPAELLPGQPAVNINEGEPGLYFADSTGAKLFKVGPCHVGENPPNNDPAGSAGNAIGEQWLDTSTPSAPVLKVWDGSDWIVTSGGGGGIEINTGTGLEGGPITGTGTISLADTEVVSGEYTNPIITVNAQGQITDAENGEPAILESIIENKGDLIIGSAVATPAILTVGNDGDVLVADSTAPLGVKWDAPSSGSSLATVTYSTGSLTVGETKEFWLDLGEFSNIISADVTGISSNLWIRMYTSEAGRVADTRLLPGPPFPSPSTGFAVEIVTDNLSPTVTLAPCPAFYMPDGAFFKVTNQDAFSQSFDVNLLYLKTIPSSCDTPPYSCNPYVTTDCVTDFSYAWQNCSLITSMPQVNLANGEDFTGAWSGCSGLVEFPPGMFDNCAATLFEDAWLNCSLSQESVDNILLSLDTAGQTNGIVTLSGGTSYPPGVVGQAAMISLEAKGWTVEVNLSEPLCSPAYPLLPPSSPPYACSTNVNTTGVTDFTSAWEGCYSITDFPCVDSSAVTLFNSAWKDCQYMTTFPAIDTSQGTNFSYTWTNCYLLAGLPSLDFQSGTDFTYSWSYCYGLTGFPLVDTSNGTNFNGTWNACYNMASFPALNLSSGTNFEYAWYYCDGLTSFPPVNVSSGQNFSAAWNSCSNLTSFPSLDVSSGTNFDSTWAGCNNLASFPLLDLSSGTNFDSTWANCWALTTLPLLDLSSGTNFAGTWKWCTGMTSLPLFDLSSGTNFAQAWLGCSALASLPLFDVSNGTTFQSSWNGCSSLISFPLLNVSNSTNFQGSWTDCSSLTSFPALDINQGVFFANAWYNCSSLTSFPAGMFDTCTATDFYDAWFGCALDQTSVDNILVSLDTSGVSGGTVNLSGGTSSAPGTAGSTAKASLIGKGWTVTTN